MVPYDPYQIDFGEEHRGVATTEDTQGHSAGFAGDLLEVMDHVLGDRIHAEERDVINIRRIVGVDAGKVTEDLLFQASVLDSAGNHHRRRGGGGCEVRRVQQFVREVSYGRLRVPLLIAAQTSRPDCDQGVRAGPLLSNPRCGLLESMMLVSRREFIQAKTDVRLCLRGILSHSCVLPRGSSTQ